MQLFLPLPAVVAALASFAVATPHQPARVSTSSGIAVGHQARNKTSVTEFLGIRYAEAPIGELRFAAPKKYVAHPGTIFEASEWSADCLANKPSVTAFPNFSHPSGLRVWKNFAAQNSNPASEDCLKLNIWTKHAGSSKAKKPVLVFIHGGRFQIPGPHSPFYSGQYLSDAGDIVVVTLNYRLGIFGFSGAPGVEKNAALLDHRAAVEWVKDNIIGFGGDPSRIVILGHSAGGASVDYWSFAHKEDPIVSGLISMSGTSLSFLPNTNAYSESLWYNVSLTIGCGGSQDDPAKVLACVRSKNASVILAAAAKVPPLPTTAITQATFHPTIDNVTVFVDYEHLSASGAFARIPLLLGNGDQEAGWYKIAGWGAGLNLTNARWTLFSERAFTCPSAYSSKYRVKHGVPVWRYRYHGDWDNLRLYNDSAGLGSKGSGAYHGADLTMLFGTAEDVSQSISSAPEYAISRHIMGAWVAFATDSSKGLKQYGWPEYDPEKNTLVRLGYNNSVRPDFVEATMYDTACPAKNDPVPGRGAF